jgi:hypothetical protein
MASGKVEQGKQKKYVMFIEIPQSVFCFEIITPPGSRNVANQKEINEVNHRFIRTFTKRENTV